MQIPNILRTRAEDRGENPSRALLVAPKVPRKGEGRASRSQSRKPANRMNSLMSNSPSKGFFFASGAPVLPQLIVFLFHAVKMSSEIGLFVWSLIHFQSDGYWYVLLAPFAYRVGLACLVGPFSTMPARAQLTLFCLSAWFLAGGLLTENLAVLIPGCLVFSGLLDSIRKQIMRRIETTVENKVLGRLVAFPLTLLAAFPEIYSGFFALFPLLVIAAFKGHFIFGSISSTFTRDFIPTANWLILVLISAHAAQYFLYCYVIWLIFPKELFPFIGPMFFSGWAGYLFGNYVFHKVDLRNSMLILAAGNALSMSSLVFLSMNLTPATLLVCFLLTGIGGSSFYVIERMPVAETRYYPWFDAIGTVLGIAVCLFLSIRSAPIEIHLWLAASVCGLLSLGALIGKKEGHAA